MSTAATANSPAAAETDVTPAAASATTTPTTVAAPTATPTLAVVPDSLKISRVEIPIGEAYDDETAVDGPFIKAPEGTTDEAELTRYRNADFRRWISLRQARWSNLDQDYIKKLETADTIEKLDIACRPNRDVYTLNELIKKEGENGVIGQIESAQKHLVNAAETRIALADKSAASSSLTREPMTAAHVVAVAKANGLNLYVREEVGQEEQTEEYKRLKANAEQAERFVKYGMQREDYDEGITESTPEAVKVKFTQDLLVAATAMRRFEEYKNDTTRSGEWMKHQSFKAKAFSDNVAKHTSDTYKRLDQLTVLDSIIIKTKIDENAQKLLAVLMFTEFTETVVFTSRVAKFVMQQPLPQTMQYSTLYNILSAALGILVKSDVAPSQEELDKKRKEENDMLAAAGATPLKKKKKNKTKKLAPRLDSAYSREECHDAMLGFIAHARDVFINQFTGLCTWYNTLNVEAENIGYYKKLGIPQPDVDVGAATRWQIYFYTCLYGIIQDYCVDRLNALEGSIILFLHEYIPKDQREYLSTVAKLPDNSHVHEGLAEATTPFRNSLRMQRAKYAAEAKEHSGRADAPVPPIPAELIDEQVDPKRNWSPTYRELQEFMRFFSSVAKSDRSQMRDSLRKFERALSKRDAEEEARREKAKAAAE